MAESSKPRHHDGGGQHRHHSCPTININPSPNTKVYVNTILNSPHWSSLSLADGFQKIIRISDTMAESSKSPHHDGDGQHHHHSCPTININPSPNTNVYVNTIINPPHWSNLSSPDALQMIRIHADTVQLDPDDKKSGSQLLSFNFDALEDGRFKIFCVPKEEAYCSSPSHFSKYEPMIDSEFQKGGSQKFVELVRLEKLLKPSTTKGDFSPLLVIRGETCWPSSSVPPPTETFHGQITEAVLEKNIEGSFQVKETNQKSWWPEITDYAPQNSFGAVKPKGEATDAAAYYKMSIPECVLTVQKTNVSEEEAWINASSETERLDIDHMIKGENVILNSLGSINVGPGAGGSNEGSFSGSINQVKGNLHHMEQYVGTMVRESVRGKSKRYQQRTLSATGQGNHKRLSPTTGDQKKYGRFALFSKELLKSSWCYLFSNFPEEWDEGRLWDLFSRYCKVIDIHISKRRDRNGDKYGFARFIDVKSSSALEERLNRIWIDEFHMRVKFICYGWKESISAQAGTKRTGSREPRKAVQTTKWVQKGRARNVVKEDSTKGPTKGEENGRKQEGKTKIFL